MALRSESTTFKGGGTTQTITVSATSAAITNAVGSQTRFIRIATDTDIHIAFGGSPTATTSNEFLPANSVEYFGITPGQKVAAIQNSAAGTVWITEKSQ